MYLFFTIFGILFCSISTIIIYYIYEIFSINKITSILKPIDKSIWNNINIAVLPTLCCAMIKTPILGFNKLFIIAVILNLCVGSSVMYIIKYSNYLLNNKENDQFVDILSIIIAVIFGQLIEGLIVSINTVNDFNIMISILSLIGLTSFVLYLKINPPKTFFFTEKK